MMIKTWISILIMIVIPLGILGQENQLESKNQSRSIREKVVKPNVDYPQTKTEQPIERGICITMEMDTFLRKMNPEMGSLEDFENYLQREIRAYDSRLKSGQAEEEVITIPVVVHVIHAGEPVGTGSNLSEVQVQSQIEAFNEHFRKVGNGANNHPDGADIKIEFALAIWDEEGKRMPEPGIDRVLGNEEGYNQAGLQIVVKKQTIWDPHKYFNIWTVIFGEESAGLLGYAQFPNSSGLDGLGSNNGTETTDGVVMNYRVFGTTPNVPFPYNHGKVCSHEVGHWLGLRHTWGDGDCGVDDYCEDTPNASMAGWSSALLGCPTNDECGEGERMVENYMDYSDDPCKTVFTQNQKTRMRTVMDVSPRRSELKYSDVHLEAQAPFAIFTSDKKSACEGTIIQFQDLSANDPVTWNWTIFDEQGNTLADYTEQNPNHLFTEIGHYDVRLIATNLAGEDTLLRSNYIRIASDSLYASVNEDFEDPGSTLDSWLVYNPDADETFQPASVSAFGVGLKSITMNNFKKESDLGGRVDALISPKMNFSGDENPYLLFDHAYARFGGEFSDTLAIFYSTDCAETFIYLWSRGGAELETADPTEESFEPSSEQWDSTKISLLALKGLSDIHLAFANISGWGNNLYLDNIRLGDFSGAQLPQPVAIRASDSSVCSGGSVQFEDLSPEFPSSWNWVFEGGIPTFSTLQSPVVQYDTAGLYDVILTVGNTIGEATDTFKTFITVIEGPAVAISANKDSLCQGEEITLTASGAEQYIWFDERSIDPVSEADEYTTKFFQNRTVYLIGTNSAGCQDTASILVELDAGADVRIIASDSLICEGDTVHFIGSGAESYIWFYDGDTLSMDQSVEISLSSSAVVGLKGIAQSGCPGFDFAQVTVSKPVAEIMVDGIELTASDAEIYQWFLNDNIILGANSQTYIAEESGSYHVSLVDENGCSDVSEAVMVEVTGIDELEISISLSAYPNPTSGMISLKINGSGNGVFKYQLIDIYGKMIQQGSFVKMSDSSSFDLELIGEPGMYFLRVSDGYNSGILKIIRN